MTQEQDWMTDSRSPWVTNSLKHRADRARTEERRCRMAFNKEYMGVPANWLADVHAEVAAIYEKKLAEVMSARKGQT